MRRVAGAVAAALIVLLLPLAPAAVAASRRAGSPAQADPAPGGRVALVHQTPWVNPGGDWAVQVRITGVTDMSSLELAVTVYRPPESRPDLESMFKGADVNGGREALVAPLETASPNPDGTYTLTVHTQDKKGSRPDAFTLPSVGSKGAPIYPVQVELREANDGPTVDRFYTDLLAVQPHNDGSQLRVTLVLPVHAPPQSSTRSGPATTPPVGSSNIDQISSALINQPNVPLVLAPTPETLDELHDADRPALDRLATAAASRQVVAQPWVPTDDTVLGDALRSEVPLQLAAGVDATAKRLGVASDSLDRQTWIAQDPLDGTLLQTLAGSGITRAVVQERDLLPLSAGRAQPSAPITLVNRPGESMPALVADPGLAAAFDPTLPAEQQALAANHLLADLAFVDSTGASGGPRVATVVAPRTWKAQPGFLSELLDGLATSPVLRGADLDDDFAGVPVATTGRNGAPITRTLATSSRFTPRTTLGARLAVVRERLSVRNAVLIEDKDRASALGEDVLTAESPDLSPADQEDRLTAVSDAADGDLHGIRMPGSRTVSLTARTGEIPITVLNDTGKVALVAVHLESDKLEFPEGATRTVSLDKQATTQVFKVRARAAGAVPLRIYLETPDGRELTRLPTKFTVRQTALPRLGLALFAVAAVVLAVWWVRSTMRTRRNVGRQPRARRTPGRPPPRPPRPHRLGASLRR